MTYDVRGWVLFNYSQENKLITYHPPPHYEWISWQALLGTINNVSSWKVFSVINSVKMYLSSDSIRSVRDCCWFLISWPYAFQLLPIRKAQKSSVPAIPMQVKCWSHYSLLPLILTPLSKHHYISVWMELLDKWHLVTILPTFQYIHRNIRTYDMIRKF